ncbi:MAG: cyclophilin-like fold protein [Anaeromyxobacteraceae bacterium]
MIAGAVQKVSEMKIRIQLEGHSVTATLEESQAAREFLSLLPLTLTLTDYNSTEKVADLPRKLSTKGAPAGVDPDIGDIAYYAPWGNLAIFYRDFGYSTALVRLGRLDSGVELLSGRGPLRVTIERAQR